MYRRPLLLIALPLLFTAVPAHATGGEVFSTSSAYSQPEGDQRFVVAQCEAFATPGTASPTDVPIATSVHCDLNGAHEASNLSPGPYAQTELIAADEAPLILCSWSTATFLDPVASTEPTYTVTEPEHCKEIA